MGGGYTCAEQFHKLNRFESVEFLRGGLSSKTFPFSRDNLSFKGVQWVGVLRQRMGSDPFF